MPSNLWDDVIYPIHVLNQAITWTNVDLLSIAHVGTNFSEILKEI